MNGKLNQFHVTCLMNAAKLAESVDSETVYSFLDPCITENEIPQFSDRVEQYVYMIYDQEEGKHAEKIKEQIERFIINIQTLRPISRRHHTIFHCHAGVSRSPAACYIALVLELGLDKIDCAFRKMIERTNKPWPNSKMIAGADELLGLKGKLLFPVEEYKKRFPIRLAAYRRLNSRRGLISPVKRSESNNQA